MFLSAARELSGVSLPPRCALMERQPWPQRSSLERWWAKQRFQHLLDKNAHQFPAAARQRTCLLNTPKLHWLQVLPNAGLCFKIAVGGKVGSFSTKTTNGKPCCPKAQERPQAMCPWIVCCPSLIHTETFYFPCGEKQLFSAKPPAPGSIGMMCHL